MPETVPTLNLTELGLDSRMGVAAAVVLNAITHMKLKLYI
jgi:hypothetical protein